MKNIRIDERKISIISSCLIYTVAVVVQIIIKPNNNIWYSIITIIAIVLEAIAKKIRGLYNRSDKIVKIFQECTEKEKAEIYEYVKKYDKKTH